MRYFDEMFNIKVDERKKRETSIHDNGTKEKKRKYNINTPNDVKTDE